MTSFRQKKTTAQIRAQRRHLRRLYLTARSSGVWADRARYLEAAYLTARVIFFQADEAAVEKVFGIAERELAAYIGAVIASTSKDDRRRSSEYRRALQYAARHDVRAKDFVAFVGEHGGIKACASPLRTL